MGPEAQPETLDFDTDRLDPVPSTPTYYPSTPTSDEDPVPFGPWALNARLRAGFVSVPDGYLLIPVLPQYSGANVCQMWAQNSGANICTAGGGATSGGRWPPQSPDTRTVSGPDLEEAVACHETEAQATGGAVVPRSVVTRRPMEVVTNEVWWCVSARVLGSSNSEAVSQRFSMYLPDVKRSVLFHMVAKANKTSEKKGGAAFKAANGKGTLLVCCLEVDTAEELPVKFCVAVGANRTRKEERAAVEHNFSHNQKRFRVPGEWNFKEHVDAATRTFDVCLKILSGATELRCIGD